MLKNQFKILSKKDCDENILNELFKIESKHFKDSNYNLKDLKELVSSKSHDFYILEFEKQVIAYCIYSISDQDVEIYKIFVEENHRRNKMGKHIILEIIEKTNAKKIYVDLNENNIIANKFYTNLGFEQINFREKYYKDGSNSISLLKKR